MKNLKLSLLTGALLVIGCGGGNNDFDGIGFDPAVPPVLVSKSYEALGGATLRVDAARGVLEGQTLNGAVFPGGSGTTAGGGQIVIAADGSFSYTPAAGFTGNDTTEIEVQGVTASVTFRIERRAIFVDNTAPAGGDGTQAAPFNTLASGVTAANQAGDILFVFAGDGTNTNLGGGVALSVAGVQFLGEGVGLQTAEGSIVEAGSRPVLQDSVVVSADNVTVGGFESRGVADLDGAVQFSNVTGARVRGMHFVSQAQSAVSFQEVQGESFVEDCQFDSNSDEDAEATVDIAQATGVSQTTIRNSNFASSVPNGPRSVRGNYQGTALSTLRYQNITATGSGDDGWDSFVAVDTGGTSNVDFFVENCNLQGCHVKAIDTDSDGGANQLRTSITNTTISGDCEPFLAEYFSATSGSFRVASSTFRTSNSSYINRYQTGGLEVDIQDSQFLDLAGAPQSLAVYQASSADLNLVFRGNVFNVATLERGNTGALNVIGFADQAALEAANTGAFSSIGGVSYTP